MVVMETREQEEGRVHENKVLQEQTRTPNSFAHPPAKGTQIGKHILGMVPSVSSEARFISKR